MRDANFTVASMHGDMPQKERDEIMKEFRGGARFSKRKKTVFLLTQSYLQSSSDHH